MSEVGENSRILASTPSSTASGCLSNDEGSDDHLLPSSLAVEELQLALNKVKCYHCPGIFLILETIGSHRGGVIKSYQQMQGFSIREQSVFS